MKPDGARKQIWKTKKARVQLKKGLQHTYKSICIHKMHLCMYVYVHMWVVVCPHSYHAEYR